MRQRSYQMLDTTLKPDLCVKGATLKFQSNMPYVLTILILVNIVYRFMVKKKKGNLYQPFRTAECIQYI